MEAEGQGHMEPVRLSDNSSDEYQMSHPGDETELNTEPERANLSGADETTPRHHRGPRLVETHGNNRPGLCQFRPTLVHRRQQLSHGPRGPCDHNSR